MWSALRPPTPTGVPRCLISSPSPSEASRKLHFCPQQNIFLQGFPNASWKRTHKCHQCPHAGRLALSSKHTQAPTLSLTTDPHQHLKSKTIETLQPIRDDSSWNLKHGSVTLWVKAAPSDGSAAHWDLLFLPVFLLFTRKLMHHNRERTRYLH